MMIRAWRITKAKHAAAAFSGAGARRFGGRWNSPGAALVYSAGSVSLALLEMLVHLEANELMKRYVLFEVTFDDTLVRSLNPSTLPANWKRSPVPTKVQRIGDLWAAAGDSAVLRVLSAIVPSESNFLLNPEHPDFPRITIGPKKRIAVDLRLLKTP